MPTVVTIDPVTRLEGHLRVDVTVDAVDGKQQVIEARLSGTSFRGFETMLVGRDPSEAPHLTQRICGVCSVPHGVAAALALEKAAQNTIPENARLLRNLVLGANFIQSHVLHFYQLSLLDYVGGPGMPPWEPQWNVDRRIEGAEAARLVDHYKAALQAVRQTNEMAAVFAGRQPHSPAFVPGGFTNVPTTDQVAAFRKYLGTITDFIRSVYVPDVDFVASRYPEYNQLGRGYGSLLAFGGFPLDASGKRLFFAGGRMGEGGKEAQLLNLEAVTEQVTHSWYDDASTNRHPSSGATQAVYPKEGAYSWLKAPRYEGQPYETGPLARMTIGGHYRQGISVHDRHRARAAETLKIVEVLPGWLDEVKSGEAVYSRYAVPAEAEAAGLTEAPRGALGHWLKIRQGKIAHYQVVTPTCWNASPRDDQHVPGPIEKALVGTPVGDPRQPVEVLRVVHSFDPCLACAVHVCRPAGATRAIVF
jgi:hydrogenase large subunit